MSSQSVVRRENRSHTRWGIANARERKEVTCTGTG
jgi:hypothetical protein